MKDNQENSSKRNNDLNEPELIEFEMPKKEVKICPNCKDEMPLSLETCVSCGYFFGKQEKRYEPMSQKKMWTIRGILSGIFIIAFVLIYVFVLNK